MMTITAPATIVAPANVDASSKNSMGSSSQKYSFFRCILIPSQVNCVKRIPEERVTCDGISARAIQPRSFNCNAFAPLFLDKPFTFLVGFTCHHLPSVRVSPAFGADVTNPAGYSAHRCFKA